MINTKLSLHFRNIYTQNRNKENRQGTLRYVSIQVSKCSESERGTSSTKDKYHGSSAIADRPRDAQFTSIRKIAKWNFLATLLGA